MKYLFSRESVSALTELAFAKVLLAFDFDGTLAPIVNQRADATMRARTARLLRTACSFYPCAVISGRGREDVASRLNGAVVKYVVGNHGLEPGAGLGDFAGEIARVRPLLETALAAADVDIEDKRYSLALHYRKSRQKRLSRSAIQEAVARLPIRMRVVPGKFVVNVVPERAPNKGDALLSLRATERADIALYVGDDVTDEDAFRLDQPGRLLTVRIGESASSTAAYFLRDQREIDTLLDRLIALREKRPAP